MNALDTAPTATYKSRTGILVECDYREERMESGDEQTALEVELIRLQCSNDHQSVDRVAYLQDTLGIKGSKVVRIGASSQNRRRGAMGFVTFSETLGPWYTKATMDYSTYATKEARVLCDAQPIEYLEITMIPRDATVSDLQTNLLSRVNSLSLHFGTAWSPTVWALLLGLKIMCGYLELRNSGFNESHLVALKQRIGKNIILGTA